MNVNELLALARDELGDVESPHIFTAQALSVYLDEAQKNFCRWTEGIEDATTSEIVELDFAAGDPWAPLDRRILKLRGITHAVTGRAYRVLSMEEVDLRGIVLDGRTGSIECFVAGLDKHTLRAWPTPTDATSFRLRVFRLPLTPLSDLRGTAELEIDEQHHLNLLLWVKARAYGRDGTELTNRERADEYAERFRKYCAQARVEQGRARHEASTVAYGGL